MKHNILNIFILTPYHSHIVRFLQRHHYTAVKPKAALIDMDGTLYDSMKNHTAAWHRLITEAGIPCTREEFYLYEGRTGASTINHLVNRAWGRDATDEEKARLYQLKTVYFNELPPVQPMPGAATMLSLLKEVGMRRVLVTGSGQNSLISRIDTDFPGIFEPGMRVTSRDVTHGKPHPSQSIVIENAPLGIEAGDRAGAFTIGVTTGPIPVEEMERAGAAVVFPSMEAFAEALPVLLYSLLLTRIDI